jgi:hypothetical protein
MGRSSPNPRLIKIHRNYSVEDVAGTLGVCKGTVRNWLKAGLSAIDDRRPTLILGSVLRRFLEDRRRKRKQPCPPGYLYCVSCRAPRMPAIQMVDYVPITSAAGNLRGICPVCKCLIHRRVSLARLAEVRGELEISFREADGRIGETT